VSDVQKFVARHQVRRCHFDNEVGAGGLEPSTSAV
jgi:hypothetical protein